MELLVEPSEETVEEDALERLEDRIAEKLDSREVNPGLEVLERFISLEVLEEEADVSSSALKYLTGVKNVYISLKCDKNPESVAETLEEEEVESGDFEIFVRNVGGDTGKESLVEALENRGWNHKGGGKKIWIYVFEERLYVSLKRLEGPGGLPLASYKTAVVPMVDRAYTYAGFEMMKRGYSLIPIAKDGDIDSIKEGIEVLEEYQLGLKPVALDSDSWKEALKKALDVFDPDIIVSGALESAEYLLDSEDFEIEVKRPLEGRIEEEVLENYGDIRSFRV